MSPQKNRRDWHDWIATIGIPLTFFAAAAAAVFTGQSAFTAIDTEHRQMRAYVNSARLEMITYGWQRRLQ